MPKYKITYWPVNSTELGTKEIEGRTLENVLCRFCDECVKQSIRGVFYSTTEHTSRRTYAVKSLYGLYYINLVSVEILNEDRTPALRELRANRERLGLSKDRFAEICGTKTYKEHEAGRRPIDVMDYLWYRKCLACYERGKDPGKRPGEAFTGTIEDAKMIISDLLKS